MTRHGLMFAQKYRYKVVKIFCRAILRPGRDAKKSVVRISEREKTRLPDAGDSLATEIGKRADKPAHQRKLMLRSARGQIESHAFARRPNRPAVALSGCVDYGAILSPP